MLRCGPELLSDLPWDISLRHVLPKINGHSHVRAIAKEADMDVVTVQVSLFVLWSLSYRVIGVILYHPGSVLFHMELCIRYTALVFFYHTLYYH